MFALVSSNIVYLLVRSCRRNTIGFKINGFYEKFATDNQRDFMQSQAVILGLFQVYLVPAIYCILLLSIDGMDNGERGQLTVMVIAQCVQAAIILAAIFLGCTQHPTPWKKTFGTYIIIAARHAVIVGGFLFALVHLILLISDSNKLASSSLQFYYLFYAGIQFFMFVFWLVANLIKRFNCIKTAKKN